MSFALCIHVTTETQALILLYYDMRCRLLNNQIRKENIYEYNVIHSTRVSHLQYIDRNKMLKIYGFVCDRCLYFRNSLVESFCFDFVHCVWQTGKLPSQLTSKRYKIIYHRMLHSIWVVYSGTKSISMWPGFYKKSGF